MVDLLEKHKAWNTIPASANSVNVQSDEDDSDYEEDSVDLA